MTETTNDRIGFLCWWTVPDLSVGYDTLAALASGVGFPAGCVPTAPQPRHAWEKATNVGSRGLKLETAILPSDLVR